MKVGIEQKHSQNEIKILVSCFMLIATIKKDGSIMYLCTKLNDFLMIIRLRLGGLYEAYET